MKAGKIIDEELFEVLDESGAIIGKASRSAVHRNPSLIHRVVHVLIFNRQGALLLQKRSMMKDVAPGKWDTSVGGHVNPGEDILAAAIREMKEELGIEQSVPEFLYTYLFRDQRESELVSTFSCTFEGKIQFSREEIDALRYWDRESIRKRMGRGIFSPHFEEEIRRFREWGNYPFSI